MISFFNKIGNTWIAKAIFVALGISMMAFWGLGGLSNTASPDKTVIKVGTDGISLSQLSKAFDAERTKFSQIAGQYLSPQQAIEMGLLQQVVQQQVAALLTKHIREDLGLAASDAAVQKYVERHPAFKDSLGHFDRNLFMTYLAQTRMTEAALAVQLREELASQHLSNTIRLVAPTSKFLAEKLWQIQNEKRDIEALQISTKDIPLSTKATEQDLREYYEADLSDFMLPETRDIQLLALTPEIITKTIQIPDAQLEALYEEQKDSFTIPEKRHIYQIRFTSEEEATEALKGLSIDNFVKVAQQKGQTSQETDFGFVAQAELLPELAQAAFTAKTKTILGPIQTDLGYHILTVAEIQSAQIPNKEEVYAGLRQKLINEASYETLYAKVRELEDLLGEGLSLKEASHKLGLTPQTFTKVEITGEALPETLRNQELLQQLFILKKFETTALVEHANGYLVAELEEIYPVQAKAFDEVKPELQKRWKTDQQKALLPDLVKKATEQMQKGSIPAHLGQVIVATDISLQEPQNIPSAALGTIFTQATGYQVATAIPLTDGALISVVKRIKTPTLDEKELPIQMEQLSGENAEALYGGVIASYADKLGVSVNQEAIQKAFSIYQNE